MSNNPYNPTTGQEYKAGNIIRLKACKYKAAEWAGFDQWFKAGRMVRKGEHGVKIMVVFTPKDENKTAVKVSTVFNLEQTEALTESTKQALKPRKENKPLDNFHVYNAVQDTFIPVKGRIIEHEGQQIGYYKQDKTWVAIEVTSGASVGVGNSLTEALDKFKAQYMVTGEEKFNELIAAHTGQHGTSPTVTEALPE